MTRYLTLIALALSACEAGTVPAYELGGSDEPTEQTDDTGTETPYDTGTEAAVDADLDGYSTVLDCDDADASVNPGATESCDNVDNDCDGEIDEGLSVESYYPDVDTDGYGDAWSDGVESCQPLEGFVLDSTDCNDADPDTYPGAEDTTGDGIDSNCDDGLDNGETDTGSDDQTDTGSDDDTDTDTGDEGEDEDTGETDTGSDVETDTGDEPEDEDTGETDIDTGDESEPLTDTDGDGYTEDVDCDDNDAVINPGAVEAFNDGIDSDCDGSENSGFAGVVIATYPDGSSYILDAAFYSDGSFPNEFSWQSSVSSTLDEDGYSVAQTELTDDNLDTVGDSCGVIVNGTGADLDNLCWGGARDTTVTLQVWIAEDGWLSISPVVWIANSASGECALVYQTDADADCTPVDDD